MNLFWISHKNGPNIPTLWGHSAPSFCTFKISISITWKCLKWYELLLTFLSAVNVESQHEPNHWAEHLSTTCVSLGRPLNLLVFFSAQLWKGEGSLNLYLGQEKVEESVSLLLFFQTGMSSLSSPWVQISLVLQAHCQGRAPFTSEICFLLLLLSSSSYYSPHDRPINWEMSFWSKE